MAYHTSAACSFQDLLSLSVTPSTTIFFQKSTANGKTPSWPSKLPGSPSKTPATKTTSVKPVDSSSGESSSDSADTKVGGFSHLVDFYY